MDSQQQHFEKIFWFLVGSVACVFVYMFMVTFFPVPKENNEHVNNILPFLEGTVLGGAFGFLVGGAAASFKKKDTTPPGTTTADISATITTQQEAPENGKSDANQKGTVS